MQGRQEGMHRQLRAAAAARSRLPLPAAWCTALRAASMINNGLVN